MKASFFFPRTVSLLGALFALGAGTAGAVTTQWTNDGTDFDWSNGANWTNAVPASGSDVLFDTGGAGTVLVSGTVTAHTLQIGNQDAAGAYQIGASAGSGTIDLTATGATENNTGSNNPGTVVISNSGFGTADEIINSNLVIGVGASNSTGNPLGYGIVNDGAGDMVFNGSITTADAGSTPSSLFINNDGTGNVTFNGDIDLVTPTTAVTTPNTTAVSGDIIVTTSVGTTVTFSGTDTLYNCGIAGTGISLGSATSLINGDMRFTSDYSVGGNGDELKVSAVPGDRLNVYGSQGAIQFDTAASGVAIDRTNGGDFIFLVNGRAKGDEGAGAQLENVSGNNAWQNVDLSHGENAKETDPLNPSSFYIESDAGNLSINFIQDLEADKTATNYQQLYLYGAGDGDVTSGISTKTNPDMNILSVFKDGSGTWNLESANSNYGGGTTVAGGTLLVDGGLNTKATEKLSTGTTITVTTSGAGTGKVLVDSTLGSGNAVLGGIGAIAGAVTVQNGGAINPGDIAGLYGATSNIGTLTLQSGLKVGAAGGAANAGKLIFEFDSSANTSDLLVVTGGLNLFNATLSLTDLGSATLADGTVFELVSYDTLTGTFANIGSTITVGNNTYEINYDDVIGGKNYITAEVVPEPATWGFLSLGVAFLVIRMRKRALPV